MNGLNPSAGILDFAFGIRPGQVGTLAGTTLDRVRELMFGTRVPCATALADLPPMGRVTQAFESIVDLLAGAALAAWPAWYGGLDIDGTGLPAVERASLAAFGRMSGIHGFNRGWAERACRLASRGRSPTPDGFLAQTNLRQLAIALDPYGPLIALGVDAWAGNPVWLSRLLHEVAVRAECPVMAVIREGSTMNIPVRDGLRFDVVAPEAVAGPESPIAPTTVQRGAPHPGSDVEKGVDELLRADDELTGLFAWNQVVSTPRGLTPRVDLLWKTGKLVVELDGFADHGRRHAFRQDRDRDFHLRLAGYTVLRITNDEFQEDPWMAMDKIRQLVRSIASQNGGNIDV